MVLPTPDLEPCRPPGPIPRPRLHPPASRRPAADRALVRQRPRPTPRAQAHDEVQSAPNRPPAATKKGLPKEALCPNLSRRDYGRAPCAIR
ncbi:hypothetical protein [Lysobacter gummosus]|uniref:hypothetical protein n=1 Tax=Lysobacter gummosus TaxID=262324 RepID=UPI00363A5C61